MTFVRAQLSERGASICSDWLVSDPDRSGPAGYIDGTLKALILGGAVCVAYAGNIAMAVAAIREAREVLQAGELDTGLELLASRTREGQCEFLVAVHDPPALHEIKRGLRATATSAWIGDHRAFELYQREAASAIAEGISERAMPLVPFARVIESASIKSVGIMTVSVIPAEEGFDYGVAMGVVSGFTPQVIPHNTPTTISFGSERDGGFVYSLMGCADEPAVGVYFMHGRFGIVSAPLKRDDTFVVKAASQIEFVESVESRYQISLSPGLELS